MRASARLVSIPTCRWRRWRMPSQAHKADAPSLIERNRALHRMLVDGVTVEYRRKDGSIAGAQARVLDFDDPDNNDWLAVNQFTVVEGQNNRRPDVVLFVNGLPLAVIELKNAADENADDLGGIQSACKPTGTDPAAVHDQRGAGRLRRHAGAHRLARRRQGMVQALAHDRRRESDAPGDLAELQVMLEGVFEKRRFLDLLRHFIVFEDEGGGELAKKMAGYHQFHAVNVALKETLRAGSSTLPSSLQDEQGRYDAGPTRRQTGRPARRRGLAHAGLRQEPDDGLLCRADRARTRHGKSDHRGADRPQRSGRPALRHVLALPGAAAARRRCRPRPRRSARAADGVVRRRGVHHDPEVLSRRKGRPIPCCPTGGTSWSSPTRRTAANTTSSTASPGTCAMRCPTRRSSASPARRSRRPTRTRGPCSAITSASTTSSARSKTRRPCRSITKAGWRSSDLDDGREAEDRPEFEEVTEGEEVERKREAAEPNGPRWRRSSARRSGSRLIAKDLVEHFEQRLEAMDGKAMIVCMSRRICVDLYNEIVKLRPDWHSDDDDDGRAEDRDDRLGDRSARVAAAHPQQAAPRGAWQAVQRPRKTRSRS